MHAEAMARYGDSHQVDARPITHTVNPMTRSRGSAANGFRKEFRHLMGLRLPRNQGARMTRPHAGGLVGVETADSRTGGFSHNLSGSLRQSLTTGAPWRAQTASREARAGLIAFTPNMAPGMRPASLMPPLNLDDGAERGKAPRWLCASCLPDKAGCARQQNGQRAYRGTDFRRFKHTKEAGTGINNGHGHRGTKCHGSHMLFGQ